jgi:hypothetical protein
MLGMGAGASATSFLLPLILGISIVTFLVTAIVTMAPTAEEMREDAALMERIATLSKNLDGSQQRLHLLARGSDPRNPPMACGPVPSSRGLGPAGPGERRE